MHNREEFFRGLSLTGLLVMLLGAMLPFLGLNATAQETGTSQDKPWVHEEKKGVQSGTLWPGKAPPAARDRGAMAFYPDSPSRGESGGLTVLFGGQQECFVDVVVCESGVQLADTWTWDGEAWAQVTPELEGSPCDESGRPDCKSPPGRSGAGLAYHAPTGKLILFGGSGRTDTWSWDGITWTEVTPEVPASPCLQGNRPQSDCKSPTARTDFSMAEHQAFGEVVLFGGENPSNREPLADTWTWDGETWVPKSPANSPPARHLATMADHKTSDEVLLFGGKEKHQTLNDTWSWNGETWNRQTKEREHVPEGSTGRMAYHAATQQVLLLNWASTPGSQATTWTWTPEEGWKRQVTSTAPPDPRGMMAYNGPSQNVVLLRPAVPTPFAPTYEDPFSVATGSGALSETWTWPGTAEATPRLTEVGLRLEPDSILADGISSLTATVTVTVGGAPYPGAEVEITTSGDARPASLFAQTQGDGTYKVAIQGGMQVGTQTVTATARAIPTGLGTGSEIGRAQAVLTQTAPPPCPPGRTDGGVWSDLDATFGCGGKVISPHAGGDLFQGSPASVDMTRQGDGILLASKFSGRIQRFAETGEPDRDFGDQGSLDVGSPVVALAVDSKDRIVALTMDPDYRFSTVCPPENCSGVRRYLPNGDLDLEFAGGNEVKVASPSPEVVSQAVDVAVQADDKVVVALRASRELGSYFGVARYTTEGNPDAEFGPQRDGFAVHDLYGVFTSKVALQADGKVVLVGWHGDCFLWAGKCNFALARYNVNQSGKRDGTLDETFNPCVGGRPPCGGVVLTEFEARANAQAHSVAIQPDRKLVVAGEYWRNGSRIGFALARYNVDAPPRRVGDAEVAGPPDGSLDESFNACPAALPCGGMVVTDSFPGHADRPGDNLGSTDAGLGRDVLVQKDGRILVAGYGPHNKSDWLLARYNPDGTLDTCGTPGFVRTRFGTRDQAEALAQEDTGEIIVAGTGAGRAALARYMGESVPSPSAPTTVTVEGATVQEPSGGHTEAPFEIKLRLDAPACEATSLDYRTQDESATAGQDYVATRGTVVFQKGDQEKVVPVPVLADNVPEDPETFRMEVSNPLGIDDPANPTKLKLPAKVAEGRAEIVDVARKDSMNPGPPPTLTEEPGISLSDTSVVEGTTSVIRASFDVALSKASNQRVSVRYATSDDSARAGEDYRGAQGALSFEPGQINRTITVDVLGDTLPEPTEAFKLALSSPQNATLLRPGATGTVYDDDRSSQQPSGVPGRQGQAAALLAPGAQLPPAAPANSVQAQGQQQAQQQLQQQLNQQAQQQVQQQAQAQAQVQASAAGMIEREREVQVEKEFVDRQGLSTQGYAAASRHTGPGSVGGLLWPGALMAFGFGAGLMRAGRFTPVLVKSHFHRPPRRKS